MAEKIHDIVTNLLDGIHGIAKSETIVGEAQKAGETTIIPVHRLRMGFGVGTTKAGAKGPSAGGDAGISGAGGAVELDPVAAIAVDRDGNPHILTVEGEPEATWSSLLRDVPDLLVRVVQRLGSQVSSATRERLLEAQAPAAALPETTEQAPVEQKK